MWWKCSCAVWCRLQQICRQVTRWDTLHVSVPSLAMTTGRDCVRPTRHRWNTSSGWPRLLRSVGLVTTMCGKLPSPDSSNVRLRPFGWFCGLVSIDASKMALYTCKSTTSRTSQAVQCVTCSTVCHKQYSVSHAVQCVVVSRVLHWLLVSAVQPALYSNSDLNSLI